LAKSGRSNSARGRLSRSADFDRVYREGRSRGNRFLVLYSFERGEDEEASGARLGISVGRKIGRAVQRNKVKRAIREAFAALSPDLPEGRDYVIVARPGAEELVGREGTEGVRASLAELVAPRSEGKERLS
jgi:ribonuclease P protein component